MSTITRLEARRTMGGFTLFELLMVVVVISVLVGITLSVSKLAAYRATFSQHMIEYTKITMGLEEYRADYGEYPVLCSPAHYSTNYSTDTSGYTPWTKADLTIAYGSFPYVVTDGDGNVTTQYYPNAAIERCNDFTNDYSLVYPLMTAPLSRGRKPYVEFPVKIVCGLAYNFQGGYSANTIYLKLPSGKTVRQLKTYAISRPVASDPISGKQWKLLCTNGLDYILATNSF